MKRLFLTFFLISSAFYLRAQQSVSIGTTETNPNAILWLKSAGQNQGLIVPIVTSVTAINTSDQDKGMLVYSLQDNNLHFRDGNGWKAVGSGTGGGSQTLTINGNVITLSGGSSIDIGEVAPAAGQPGQILMWNGSSWTSSSVTLPQAGQVLKWNATTNSWTAQSDDTGTGTLPALSVNQIVSNNGTGNIAVTLVGDISLDASTGNISVKPDAITNTKIADNAVTSDKITDGTITTNDIQDAAITGADIEDATIETTKIAPSSATEGQVLKFVSGNWTAAADDTGTGTLPAMSQNQLVSNNGSSNIAITVGGDLTLDATAGQFSIAAGAVDNTKLAADAVTSSNIQDGTITTTDINAGAINNSLLAADAVQSTNIANGTITDADIAAGTISYGKLATTGATDGEVLTFNQTSGAWEPQAPSGGGATYTAGTGISIDGSNVISANVGTAANQLPQLDGSGKLTATVLPTGVDTNSGDDLTTASTAGGDISGTFSALQIGANAVGAAEIAADAVGTSEIATDGVGAAEIAADAVGTSEIATDGVGAAEIAADAVTNSEIAPNTITGTELSSSIAITTSGAVATTGNLSATGANVTLNPTTALTLRGATWPSSATTTAGFFLRNDGTGVLSWASASTGTDVTAQTGVLIGASGAITGRTATGGGQIFRRNAGNTDYEFATLSASDITTGTLALANGGTGATTAANARTNLGLGTLATLSAVGSTEITNLSIVDGDVSTTAAIAGTKISPAFGAQNISTTGTGSLTIAGTTSLGNSLAVTGATTLGSTLGVTGNTTLGGTLGVTGNTTLSSLAGTGIRMVVASATGVLGTQSIPTSFSTANVVPKGDGTGLTSSLISDDGNSVTILSAKPTASLILQNSDPTGYGFEVFQRSTIRAGVAGGIAGAVALQVGNQNDGIAPTTTTGTIGATFTSSSSSGENKIGIQSIAEGPTSSKIAVWGRALGEVANYALAGEAVGTGYNVGTYGYAADGTNNFGATFSAQGINSSENFGVQAEATTSVGTATENIGGRFTASGLSTRNIGVHGVAYGGTVNWAGYFEGDLTFSNHSYGITFPVAGAGSAPMINMFETGTANSDRMVIAHSKDFTDYGLQYQDLTDEFHFLSAGTAVLTADLGTARVGVYQANPAYPLDVTGQVNSTDKYSISGMTMVRGNSGSIFLGNNAGGTTASSFNTLIGSNAGASTTGISNTFIGYESGLDNTSGGQNVFVGIHSGANNTDGDYNTFIGRSAGITNTSGGNNTMLGGLTNVGSAGLTNATAIGYGALVSQSNSMVLGNGSVNVGIGTSTPGYFLDLQGNDAGWVANFDNTNTSTGDDVLRLEISSSGTPDASSFYLGCYQNTSLRGGLRNDGSGGFELYAASDRRLKENIVDVTEYGLSTIMSIRPRKYNFIGYSTPKIGFIAQELKAVYPAAVRGDENGDPQTDPMMVSYSELVPVMIKGMQEQQQTIEKQQAEIEALKKMLSELQNTNNSTTDQLKTLTAEVEKIKQALGMEADASNSKK